MDRSLEQEVAAGASSARILDSTIGQSSRSRPRGAQPVSQRIVPGRPDASVLALRMRSRNPLTQMPPVGTQLEDVEGLALIEHWIHHELPSQKEIMP